MTEITRRTFTLTAAAFALAGCTGGRFLTPVPPMLEPRPVAALPDIEDAPSRYRPPYIRGYAGIESPGAIIINNANYELSLIESDGYGGKVARVYAIGIGREGFTLSPNTQFVIRAKREWPRWTPPEEMRERELRQNGRVLPKYMEGGVDNPLGARALYLHKIAGGDSGYRIHGTTEPHTIGTRVSSGCIRLVNEDVIDLYERVHIGAPVAIIAAPAMAYTRPSAVTGQPLNILPR